MDDQSKPKGAKLTWGFEQIGVDRTELLAKGIKAKKTVDLSEFRVDAQINPKQQPHEIIEPKPNSYNSKYSIPWSKPPEPKVDLSYRKFDSKQSYSPENNLELDSTTGYPTNPILAPTLLVQKENHFTIMADAMPESHNPTKENLGAVLPEPTVKEQGNKLTQTKVSPANHSQVNSPLPKYMDIQGVYAKKDLLWGGRFTDEPSEALKVISKSTHFDYHLAPDDIAGSKAHLRALFEARIVDEKQYQQILAGLNELEQKVTSGTFVYLDSDEDVHTAMERGLIEIIGEDLGGRIRAGRSRNDQVVTLFRRYLRRNVRRIASLLLDLGAAIIFQARVADDAVMPGKTHLQPAQPVLVGHHLLAHVWPILRNISRMQDWDRRTDECGYGSGAVAGNTLGLDAKLVARQLGFYRTSLNSIDATASRDFVAELSFIFTMVAVDLSRLCEEIILWNSFEYSYITLNDAFATGSSLMPQKKNPDIAELTRGKAGRMIGDLTGLLATLKSLPFGYNRDLQEDKEPIFDQLDQLTMILPALTGLVGTWSFNFARMRSLSTKGYTLATDIAEWLVQKGVPFRQAHETVGNLVKKCEERSIDFDQLKLEELAEISPHFTPEVYELFDVDKSVEKRNGISGTAEERVNEQIRILTKNVERLRKWASIYPQLIDTVPRVNQIKQAYEGYFQQNAKEAAEGKTGESSDNNQIIGT